MIYEHFKGNRYRVLFEAQHTETGEFLVVYQGLKADDPVWARPAEMFHDTVEVDGTTIPRFTLIEAATVDS